MLDDADIADPIAFSPRETGVNIFAFKVGGDLANRRLVNILQHVDVDNGVDVIRDVAGD